MSSPPTRPCPVLATDRPGGGSVALERQMPSIGPVELMVGGVAIVLVAFVVAYLYYHNQDRP